MIRHNCIPLESSSEWKDALKGIKHSFAHTWENCYAMNLTTDQTTYLYCFENNNTRIVCPIAEREHEGYKDIVTPYGFSGFVGNNDCEDFPNYWKEFVKEKNYLCGYISLNPVFGNHTFFESEDACKTTSLYFLDLTLSLSELFDNLDANRKKQIKDFKKIESKFIYDRDFLTDFFINNYYDFLKRIKASSANYFSRETLEYICNLENVFMVGVGEKEKIEAVYIFVYTQYIGDCLFNVANPKGRHHSARLLWSGVKFFRSKKIPLMNLGGGIIEDDNIARSKQRFGAYKLSFINLKQVYDIDMYEKLCLQKNIDPNDRSGYFPAYRKN